MEWVDIKERSPQEDSRVLVFDSDEGICVGKYSFDYWNLCTLGDFATGGMLFHVTHWMQLPQPPKGDNGA